LKKRTVAVDDSLSPILDNLRRNGYLTVKTGAQDVDAIIINGIDDNFMGMENIKQDVPIINAQGKTAEQVLRELEQKF
jgi:hypothetical protein